MRIVLGAYALKLGLLIGGFITAALLTRRLDLSLAWLGFASAAVLVCYELPISRLRQSARMVGSAAALKKIGFISLPLATVLMISALQASIPRFFLKKTGSLEAVGIFAALSYFCVFGGFISAAMTNALSPILSEHRAQCRWASFRRALLLVVGADFLLALGLLLLFWCAGGWLLGIMFSAEVVPYARYLPLVALLALTSFWDAHLGCALTALRRFKSNLVVQIARLLVATPLALFLIQRWQLPGALWASIAFPCSSFIALIALIWRDVRGIEALPVRVHENSIGPIGLGALSGTSPSK
jgi:O-antigen/teichoic acid export membrane protein